MGKNLHANVKLQTPVMADGIRNGFFFLNKAVTSEN